MTRALPPQQVSTAAGTGHYVAVDRPDLAIKAIQRVTAQATRRW
ncbi:hypothetical protein AB0G67_46820 [Streptomyces sp. NPDC021056]